MQDTMGSYTYNTVKQTLQTERMSALPYFNKFDNQTFEQSVFPHMYSVKIDTEQYSA